MKKFFENRAVLAIFLIICFLVGLTVESYNAGKEKAENAASSSNVVIEQSEEDSGEFTINPITLLKRLVKRGFWTTLIVLFVIYVILRSVIRGLFGGGGKGSSGPGMFSGSKFL